MGKVMNRYRHISLIGVMFAISMAGCASAPNQKEIAEANYGNPMSPADCKALAQRTIASQLKDPSSAQFRSEQPCFKGWLSSVPIYGMKAEFGYLQKGEVNGKNSYGGYVGFRPYMVIMRNGSVVRSCLTDSDGICSPRNH